MILFIDTTDLQKTVFALIHEDGKTRPIKKTVEVQYHESSTTLAHLDKFLRANKALTTNHLALSTIIFCSGPGSFTGIRIAASIVQALALSWNIPIHALLKEKVPRDLRELSKLKLGKKITIEYGRPAV